MLKRIQRAKIVCVQARRGLCGSVHGGRNIHLVQIPRHCGNDVRRIKPIRHPLPSAHLVKHLG